MNDCLIIHLLLINNHYFILIPIMRKRKNFIETAYLYGQMSGPLFVTSSTHCFLLDNYGRPFEYILFIVKLSQIVLLLISHSCTQLPFVQKRWDGQICSTGLSVLPSGADEIVEQGCCSTSHSGNLLHFIFSLNLGLLLSSMEPLLAFEQILVKKIYISI